MRAAVALLALGLLAPARAGAAPPPLAPHVTRVETVARDAQVAERPPGSPGDTWGGQQSRIVRRADGSLLVAYLTSPRGLVDPSGARWVLVRRGPRPRDRWTELARGPAGREPMHLVRGPGGDALLVAWPGTPRSWRIRGDAVGPGRAIPGGWERMRGSSTPYGGVGIGRGGRVCLVAARSDAGRVAGAPYTADSAWDVACRSPRGRWTPFRTLPLGLRFAYPFVHVRGDGAVDVVGTRDVLWEAEGIPQVPGTFAYLFDAVERFRLRPGAAHIASRLRLGATPATTPATGAPHYAQTDSLIDRRGRLHVLVEAVTSGGASRLEHVLVERDGTVRRATLRAPGAGHGLARLVEDPYGRLLVLVVQGDAVRLYRTRDRDGLVLGRGSDLTARLTGGLPTDAYAYVASVRGGTPRSRLVDLVLTLQPPRGRPLTRYARLELW